MEMLQNILVPPPLIDSAPVLGIKNDQSLRIYRQSISGLPYAVTGARAIFIFYILKIFLKSLNDLWLIRV